ncbi:hypothetical protein Taro_026744 [Colocasia esculenta]|uniref:CBM20 domain-containing protein n=1 Tax=Colocasia esculenta TaxID=4460 RepID=A0A843VI09_COLES|nr:hypothetical protein [Colocasia esculenta]
MQWNSAKLTTLRFWTPAALASAHFGSVGAGQLFPGDSVRSTSRDLCKVLWTIEADVADDQLLYITGDPAALGCWEPEKAIPMSPCKEQAKLWITETEAGYLRLPFVM